MSGILLEKPGQGLEGDWELAHDVVQIIENRMISIMDGKGKPDKKEKSGELNPPSPEQGQEKTVVVIPQDDGDSPGEDRDGDSPREDRDGDSPEGRDGDSPG